MNIEIGMATEKKQHIFAGVVCTKINYYLVNKNLTYYTL